MRNDLALLAPKFAMQVQRLLIDLTVAGFDPVVRETLRTEERQRYLYGFGREYDDDRGVVTNSPTADTSWHGFGLAADIVSAKHGDNASAAFIDAIGAAAKKLGLTWGGDWEMPGKPRGDWPHVQHGAPMRKSPSPLAKQIVEEHGLEALWRTVQAAA
jgi:peptidoglycan L-alanyl-D-glutamate endopeptidase CwlK